MAAGVDVDVGFDCAAFDFFFCLLLFAVVAAVVVVAGDLLGVFVGAAAVGVDCCCFCGLASFSPALMSLSLLLGFCFFFFFFFCMAVSGVAVIAIVSCSSDLERFLGFSSGNTVLCLQTAQSTACGNEQAFKRSERKKEREAWVACTYHTAAHSLLYPLGAFSGRST